METGTGHQTRRGCERTPHAAVVSAPEFIGREDQLAAVVGALADPPTLVLIEGEPGIGKTRLVRECLAGPSLLERRVMVGACLPLREPLPLGPVVDGLRRLREQVGDLELSPLAGALRPLFPEWAADLPPAVEPLEDPRATRHRLFRALTEVVQQLGVDVLLVDDAHWADTATLEFLLMLSMTGDQGTSLVVTYRPTDVPAGSLLLQLTSRLPTAMRHARVQLGPLDPDEVRRLVGSMFAGAEVSAQFASFLHERTAGVPLAVEETLLLLRDRRDIVHRGGKWTRRVLEELQVPPTVRDSVLERVERLQPVVRRVLEAAAVLAEPAGESLLALVAGLTEARARRGLAGALASGLLREATPDRFAFRHVLASKAVEEAIPVSERRRLHRRAAEGLQQLDRPPVVRLSRHFQEAGDATAWARYAEEAADFALESADDHMAVVVLNELLTTIEHPTPRRVRLALKLGKAANLGLSALGELGDRVVATLRATLARDDVPPAERGRICLLLGSLLVQQGDAVAGRAEVERAVPDLEHAPAVAARAMIGLSWPWLGARPAAEHHAWLDRATALMSELPESERVALEADRATALLMLGESVGWQAAADLPADAGTLAARQDLARAYVNIGHFAIIWGRYAQARAWLDTALMLADPGNDPRLHNGGQNTRAHLDYCTGAWSGLAAAAVEVAASAEALPLWRLEATMIEGLVALAAGNTHAGEQALRSVVAGFENAGLTDLPLMAAAALARLQLAAGSAAHAVAATDDGMETIMATGLWLYAAEIAPIRVEALTALGDIDQAEALVQQFAAWLDGRDAPAPEAALLACRAGVAAARGDSRRAAALFAEAARAWAALPRPYDELLAIEREGRCLLAAGETSKALALLAATEQRLSDLGARWDADRVAYLLRQHNVDVARAWRGGRHGFGDTLSPRELEVVRLVATGLTNRQVAEALFLSPKTIAYHVSRAMRKLGVSSRTALAVNVAEMGLLAGEQAPRNERNPAAPSAK